MSLPAEDLYFLTDFGQNRIVHPRLPSNSALGSRGYPLTMTIGGLR